MRTNIRTSIGTSIRTAIGTAIGRGAAAAAIALALAAAGAASAALAPAAPAWADAVEVQHTDWQRLEGDDRYGTAEAVAREGWGGYDTCADVVVSGANYPDALTASVLAGVLDGPVRLATRDAYAPARTFGYYVVGGEDAVPDKWDDRYNCLGRVAGETAVDTAVAVAAKARELGADSDFCIVATRDGFADALSAAPWSYASGAPILLVSGAMTGDALGMAANYPRAVIVGGASAVPASVEAQLASRGCSVERIAGESAQETSAAVAQYAVDAGDLSWDGAGFATRDNYPDALCGAALCGRAAAPVLLVGGADASVAAGKAKANREAMHRAYVLGGPAAVPAAVEDALRAATTERVEASGEYTVTWRNFDGTLLKTERVAAGRVPEEAKMTYTFSGYCESWFGEDSSHEGFDVKVSGGTTTFTTVPQREDGSYVFDGWDTPVSPATCDKTYTATYRYLPNDYYWDGVLHCGYDTAQTVHDNIMAYQADPTRRSVHYATAEKQGRMSLVGNGFEAKGHTWTMSHAIGEPGLGGSKFYYTATTYYDDLEVTRIMTDEEVHYVMMATNSVMPAVLSEEDAGVEAEQTDGQPGTAKKQGRQNAGIAVDARADMAGGMLPEGA